MTQFAKTQEIVLQINNLENEERRTYVQGQPTEPVTPTNRSIAAFSSLALHGHCLLPTAISAYIEHD